MDNPHHPYTACMPHSVLAERISRAIDRRGAAPMILEIWRFSRALPGAQTTAG